MSIGSSNVDKLSVGNLVICRGEEFGIILEIEEDAQDNEEELIWTKIMWSNGQITWEDILTSWPDIIFEVLE